MKKIYLFLILFILFFFYAPFCHAQECGTVLSPDQYEKFMEMEERINELAEKSSQSFGAASYHFPVKLYLISDSDGNKAPDLDEVIDDLISTNEIFSETGVSFYVCDYIEIKSDKYNDLDLNEEQDDLFEAYYDNSAINVYIVEKLTKNDKSIGGVGSWPSMDDQRIILINSLTGNGTSLTHEFGHYFNLLHTHDEVENGKDFIGSDKSVFGVKFCQVLGDLCCDTPPDPGLKEVVEDPDGNCNCTYVGKATDVNGNTYFPDLYNLMSYNPHRECRTKLTAEQRERVQKAATIRDQELSGCEAADLVIGDMELNTNIILPGDEVEVKYIVRNTGDVISNSGKVAFYISEQSSSLTNSTIITQNTYRRIDADGRRTLTASLRIPNNLKGGYFIHAEVDHEHLTPEYDESNNFIHKKVYIGQPDIVTKDEAVEGKDGTSIQSGGKIDVTSKVYNNGGGYAGGSLLHYYLSTNQRYDSHDRYLGLSVIDELVPSPLNGIINQSVSRTLQLPSDVASFIKVGSSKGIYQDYYILLVCDASNNVSEIDETNNVAAVKIYINAATDLEITHLDLSADRMRRSTDLTINYTVKNTGTKDASRSTKIKFYLSDNRYYDTDDTFLEEVRIKALDSQEELSGTHTVSRFSTALWPHGHQFILAIVDQGELVDEGNEDNNIERHELEIYLPISTSTSSSSADATSMRLYPNPANRDLTLNYSISAVEEVRIIVLDITGKVLRQEHLGQVSSGSHSRIMDVTDLTPGLYIAQLQIHDRVISKRFTVQR